MNLVEIYLKKIYEEKPFNFKGKKFPNIKFIKVTATWEYYGKTEKKTKVFDIDRWNKIKKEGYYLG